MKKAEQKGTGSLGSTIQRTNQNPKEFDQSNSGCNLHPSDRGTPSVSPCAIPLPDWETQGLFFGG